MGRPHQGNKAQTPVGYSHGTGVSTGGLATAVTGAVARDTPGVHRFVWGQATSLPALRCMRCDTPLACYTGLWEHPAGPGSGEVCIEDCDGMIVRNKTAAIVRNCGGMEWARCFRDIGVDVKNFVKYLGVRLGNIRHQ